MRTPILAGNWKMFKTPTEAVEFAKALKPSLAGYIAIEQVVIPPYVALSGVAAELAGSNIKVGAQDVHHKESGAYTSSIAANMLVGLVEYVVVGHSETRQYLGVTDELVNQKTKAALATGLKPIVALGENLDQRKAGEAAAVCRRQTEIAFRDIDPAHIPNMVIAYEPIWAIGTGENASGDDANEIIGGVIRPTIEGMFGAEAAQAIRIQYGGSVKPENVAEYMSYVDIDGALIGGASLKVDSFTDLIRLTKEAKGL